MIQKLLLLLFLLMPIFVSAQSQTVQVGGAAFVLKTFLLPNESGDSIQKLRLFRGNTPLLTHTLYQVEGDCNSESVALGTWETTDSGFVFYSYWARAGDAPVSPFGVRKQVYSVGKSGQLTRTAALLYIETSREGWYQNQGIRYLFSPPKNAGERAALQEYIRKVETSYGARFVTDPAAQKALFKEVRAKLQKAIAEATDYWEEAYADMLGGYKR